MNQGSTLKGKTIKSILWSGIEKFSSQGMQLIITFVLAMLLDPSEFGLIAVLVIIISISQTFIDSGFSNSLVQNNQRTEKDFSTAFYFNLLVALFIYIVLFFLAPVIAGLYDNEIYVSLIRILGLNVVIFSLTLIQRAKLTIQLDFKSQAKATIAAVIIGGAAGITSAVAGLGVWSLVIQQLTANLTQCVFLWIISGWLPKERFYAESFKKMFKYGSNLLAAGLLKTIYQDIYASIIGKQFTEADAGLFHQGQKLAQFPSTNLSSVMTRAVFPILSEMQDDKELLSKAFHKYIKLSFTIIAPLMLVLAALAGPVIYSLLPERWNDSAIYLTILSLAFVWYPVSGINSLIIYVTGQTKYSLISEIWKKLFGFAILIVSLYFDLIIIASGLILYNIIDMIISIIYAKKVIKTSILKQIKMLAPMLCISIVTALITYYASNLFTGHWLQLIVGLLVAGVSLTALLFIFQKKEMKEMLSMIKHLKF